MVLVTQAVPRYPKVEQISFLFYARKKLQVNIELLCNVSRAGLFHVLCSLQSGATYHSLGFEDENLESSPGWWAATVATYCPSRPGELPKFLSSKPCE